MTMRRKSDLATKTCAVCGRPFAWRKKWERVWDEVRYCSERCRRDRTGASARSAAHSAVGLDRSGRTAR